jgi:hypothetical protein
VDLFVVVVASSQLSSSEERRGELTVEEYFSSFLEHQQQLLLLDSFLLNSSQLKWEGRKTRGSARVPNLLATTTPSPAALHSSAAQLRASQKILQNFSNSPSHRIFNTCMKH